LRTTPSRCATASPRGASAMPATARWNAANERTRALPPRAGLRRFARVRRGLGRPLPYLSARRRDRGGATTYVRASVSAASAPAWAPRGAPPAWRRRTSIR
jgi:hypothetical protein